MIKKNKFLQEEEKNEKIIKKFVDDASNIKNWKNEDLERIEKIINPSLVVNKKLRNLTIFCGSYFYGYFDFVNDKKNYIISTDGFNKKYFKNTNFANGSILVSIRKGEDDIEINLLNKRKKKPFEIFRANCKPSTSVIIKFKPYKSNNIEEIKIKTNGYDKTFKNAKKFFFKFMSKNIKKTELAFKEWKREFFYSGLLTNSRMNEIKNIYNDNELEYKHKTLIDKFISSDPDDSINLWPDHLLERLTPIIKKKYLKHQHVGKFKIFQASYHNFLFEKDTLRVNFMNGEHNRDTVENIQLGDKILSITPLKKGKKNKVNVNNEDELNIVLRELKPWSRVKIEFETCPKTKLERKRKKGLIKETVIQTISFFQYLQNRKETVKETFFPNNNKKTEIWFKEFKESYILGFPILKPKRIKEIMKMDLKDDPVENEYDDEYQDDKNINIFTTVKKKKINGKESFVVKFNDLPDDDFLQKKEDEGKKIYLKIYIYDVTDLKSDKYYEIQDTTGETEQYFSNNCHVVKTEDFSWSEGNNILVQSKKLEPFGDRTNEIAFPYSVMQLPKYGKRKLSFRSFICTEDQKFDENNGRFISYENPCFRPEEYYLNTYDDSFDEYGDYPEILSYCAREIEVDYKQPGYLEVNRIKYNDLKIALSFALTQNEEENLKGNFEKIKEDIRYGDFSIEGNIYKILNLKKNYEKALNNKIKLDDILKDLKKNSVIHERYEIIDFLLNLATKDETFSKKENNFIDKVSKELELNKEKYQEIKKQKTASVKFVDFGDKTGESVFGITKEMNKEEKLKTLRKEYSRWNALTNNSDKTIRERAREMRDLAANLRSQYTN